MSNLPQQNTIKRYLADGSTSVYAYNFLILSATTDAPDISVWVTPLNTPAIPNAQIQPINIAYTVQNVGNVNGGTITFQMGYIPPANSTVTIARTMNVSISTQFNQAQNFNGQNLDDSFERVVLIEQQIQSDFNNLGLYYAINSAFPVGQADQLMPLLGDQQIWQKVNGAIQAVTLEENPDTSTLRSQLASELPSSDGAGLIGYYDENNANPITLSAFLNALPAYITTIVGDNYVAPQMTVYKSGAGIYSLPVGARHIYVKGVGAGASGVASGGPQIAGNDGASTLFGSTVLGGGKAGQANGTYLGGLGGVPSGTLFGFSINGGNGESGAVINELNGSSGGVSAFGGNGFGGTETTGIPNVVSENTGSGGAGGTGSLSDGPGAGGGAGAYIEGLITNPASTYAYSIGAGGAAVGAGSGGNPSGKGADGCLIIIAYFQ